MNNTMKVVTIDKPGSIKVVEKPIPVPQKGEALLKIKYCGICGSDIQTYTGNQPFASYPRIPGHEFSAEIVSIEENNLGLHNGMLVTANPYFNCGKCYSCRKGKVNCCEQNQTMGVQRDGSFSQYITMPIERIYNGVDLEPEILSLVEPFSIGYHAATRGNINETENVLVLGAGPIGIFAMISARLKGANVYIADYNKERLKYAKLLGAVETIDLNQDDLRTTVNKITNNDGMDVVMEAVGIPQSFLNAIDIVAFGGKIILIGNGTKETTFNHSILLKKEIEVYGSRNSLNDFQPLIEYLKSDKIDIKPMITNIYNFENTIDAFNDLINNPNDKLKVMIKFD